MKIHTGEIVAVAGGAGIAGLVAWFLTRKPPAAAYTVLLTETSTSMPSGQAQDFTASVSVNGSPVPGAAVTLTDTTTGAQATAVTSAFGIAFFSVAIADTGVYTFRAEAGGVQSNIVTATVTGVSCPCGYYYDSVSGGCSPLTPAEVKWYIGGTAAQSGSVDIGITVREILIPLVLGYTVEGVTERINAGNAGLPCPAATGDAGLEKTISGAISLGISAVTNSDQPIGCSTVNLSMTPASASAADETGVTWTLTFSLPSSVATDADGTGAVALHWTLTRSWDGDAFQLGIPPSSEALSFGTIALTGSLPDSVIAGSLILAIESSMCYYT